MPSGSSRRQYPRVARVNELLREILAEEIERIDDRRLGLATVTGVTVDGDLRHAKVWLSSMDEAAAEALAENRWRLQSAIGRQARLRRTPELTFDADPGVAAGTRVDDILRSLEDAHNGDGDGA
jgi:ribosome-binding factor A